MNAHRVVNDQLLVINDAYTDGLSLVFKKETITFLPGGKDWVKTLDPKVYETDPNKVTEKIGEFIEQYKFSLDPNSIKKFKEYLEGRIQSVENSISTSGILGKIRWVYFCFFRKSWEQIQTQKKSLDEISQKVEVVWEKRKKQIVEVIPNEEIGKGDKKNIGLVTPMKKAQNTPGTSLTNALNLEVFSPQSSKKTKLQQNPFSNNYSSIPSSNPPTPPKFNLMQLQKPPEPMLPKEPECPDFSGHKIKDLDLNVLKEQCNAINVYLEKLNEPLKKLTDDYNTISVLLSTTNVSNGCLTELKMKKEQCDNIAILLSKSIEKESDCELELLSKNKSIIIPFTIKEINEQEIEKNIEQSNKQKIKRDIKNFQLKYCLEIYKKAAHCFHEAIQKESFFQEKCQFELNELQKKLNETYTVENLEGLKKLLELKNALSQKWLRFKNSRNKLIEIKTKLIERTKVCEDVHHSSPKKSKDRSSKKGVSNPNPTSSNNYDLSSSSSEKSSVSSEKSSASSEKSSDFLSKLQKSFNAFDQNIELFLINCKKLGDAFEESKDQVFFEFFTKSIFAYLHVPSHIESSNKQESNK